MIQSRLERETKITREMENLTKMQLKTLIVYNTKLKEWVL